MLKVARLQDGIKAVAELHKFILRTRRPRSTTHEGGGSTSQLDLPSLTPLSVAGCGRLQLGATSFGYFSRLLYQLIIDPKFCGSRCSTGRLMVMEDFTFTFIINICLN